MRDAGRGTPRGDFAEEMCAVRDAINNGIIAGPRLLILAECVITGAHLELLTLPRAMHRVAGATADGPWELRKKVRELIRSGADGIKTSVTGGVSLGTDPEVRNMTQEELDAITDEAHAFKKPVAVHCFTPEGLHMCVNAKVDTIEHMVYSDEESIARVSESGIWVVPTLLNRTEYAIDQNARQGLPAISDRDPASHAAPLLWYLPRDESGGCPHRHGNGYPQRARDGVCPPENSKSTWDEGMTPMQSIQTATRDAGGGHWTRRLDRHHRTREIRRHSGGAWRSAGRHQSAAGSRQHRHGHEGRRRLRRPSGARSTNRASPGAWSLAENRPGSSPRLRESVRRRPRCSFPS